MAAVSRVLAVLGDLVEDVVVWVDDPVRRGTDTTAHVFRSRGGSAANVAVRAAGLVPTRFLGCVGADPRGDQLVAQLAGAGVDVRVQQRGRTGTVVVLVEPGGERTMLPDRAAATDLQPLAPGDLDDVALLHVPAYGLDGGSTADVVTDLLGRLPVSVDASSTAVLERLGPQRVRALLEQVGPRLVLANADEARVLQLGDRRLSGVTVVVKDGARATTVLHADGHEEHVDVPPVDGVRDSTGAGDAFAAGVLAALLDGRGVRAGVEAGHELARAVLTQPGAGTPAPRTAAAYPAAQHPAAQHPAGQHPAGQHPAAQPTPTAQER